MYNSSCFWASAALLRRLLPLVVELRSKDLVVVSGLAAVLGPPAYGRRYVTQLAVRSALRRFAPWSGLRPLLHIARPSGRLGAAFLVQKGAKRLGLAA